MATAESYGPDYALVAFWTLIASPPALISGYVLLRSATPGMYFPFAITLILALAPIVFASRFRLTFAPSEFVYRRWGRTVRVPYSDIDRIEVTNVTPITKQPIGSFIVTKRGSRLPFWPKLFPREAVERFFALAS
jgi:hypothetical protein